MLKNIKYCLVPFLVGASPFSPFFFFSGILIATYEMLLKPFFPQVDKLECFSELGDASKLQRFSEEKPLCTAERGKQCLFYLGLNVDIWKCFLEGKKNL